MFAFDDEKIQDNAVSNEAEQRIDYTGSSELQKDSFVAFN